MISATPPRSIICLIAGFTQHRLGKHGISALHEKIKREWYDRRESLLLLESWKISPVVLAEKISFHRGPGSQVAFISYSWGNPTAVRTMTRLGFPIDYWAAIDPVPRRSPLWFSPRNVGALTRFGRIRVPSNVSFAQTWRQTNNRPLGRRLVSAVGAPIEEHVYGADTPAIRHASIQDHAAVHDTILAQLTKRNF